MQVDSVNHLSGRQFRVISELIEGRVGIKLPPGKRLMLEGRLQKRVRALRHSSLNEYADSLFDAGLLETEHVHLSRCVRPKDTVYVREPSHFDFIRNVALAELLALRDRA